MCTTYLVSVVDLFDNPRRHEVVQSLLQLIRGQAAHFLEFRERQVEVGEGEDDLQVLIADDEVSPPCARSQQTSIRCPAPVVRG